MQAQGQDSFRVGSYVMLRTVPRDKTQLRWKGPYVIVRRAPDIANAYVISDLQGQQQQTEAVANLHVFRRGRLTDAQLAAEATQPGEYLVERVRDHYIAEDKEIFLLIDWVEYEPSDPEADKSWNKLADCHWAPAVKAYIKTKRLQKAVRAHIKALGPLPRS